jgi:hypothetical protein
VSAAATLRLIRLADVPAQPWRNGGGVTRELLTWPQAGPAASGTATSSAGALPWQLRLSVAEVEADGPFSTFAGVTRWFAVLGGAGVVLDVAGTRHRVQSSDAPLCFDGAAATTCRLIDGPTRDLNLMLRQDVHGGTAPGAGLFAARAGVPWHPPQGGACGLYSVQAGFCEVEGQAVELPSQALLWFDQAPGALTLVDAAPGQNLTACWISAGAGVAP